MAVNLEAELRHVRWLYMDLLYAVQNEHPGETRHETAKRIIVEHETRAFGPAQQTECPEVTADV